MPEETENVPEGHCVVCEECGGREGVGEVRCEEEEESQGKIRRVKTKPLHMYRMSYHEACPNQDESQEHGLIAHWQLVRLKHEATHDKASQWQGQIDQEECVYHKARNRVVKWVTACVHGAGQYNYCDDTPCREQRSRILSYVETS